MSDFELHLPKPFRAILMANMNWIALFITVGIGMGTVFQGTLNKEMSKGWGLASVMMLNNIVVVIVGLAIYLAVRSAPLKFSEIFRLRENLDSFQWWHIVPGLCGVAIVAGIPWAISQIGALKVFLLLVSAQMVTSALMDIYVEGVPLNAYRIVGISLAVSGALLTFAKG